MSILVLVCFFVLQYINVVDNGVPVPNYQKFKKESCIIDFL